MPSSKPFTIEKTIVEPGIGCDGPCLGTVCKIIINTVDGGTSEDLLEEYCKCSIGKEVELKLGFEEGELSRFIDILCKKMKKESIVLCKIHFHSTSMFIPGQNVSFCLHLLSWKDRSTPLYWLKPGDCFDYANESKTIGTKLFKNGKFYVSTYFYSNAIKYLTIGRTAVDITDDMLEKIKELLVLCHINIAACFLKHNFYSEVIANCNAALQIQPNNIKALYRRSLSYLGINDLELARKDIILGMSLDKHNKGFLSLSNKLKKKSAEADADLSARLKVMFT